MELIGQKMKEEVQRSNQAFYEASDAGTFIRDIQNKADQQILKAKEKLALMETDVENLKKDNKENVQIFGETLDQILPHIKNMTE